MKLTGHQDWTGEKLNMFAEIWCEILPRREVGKDQELEGSVREMTEDMPMC